jgi:hypothetical protein
MARNIKLMVDQLGADLEQALGENLVAFCLYGPAVRHDTREEDREATTLLIVRDVAPAALRPIEAAIAAWSKRGNPPPLIFAEDGWRNSADVFPIEIEDMREAHLLVRGRDPFGWVPTTKEDLRRELEREMRGKLLRLRTEFVAAAPHGKALGELLLDSAATFFVLFRAVLRLTDRDPPQTPRTLVQEVAEVAGLEAAAFDWVLDRIVGHNVQALRAYDPVGDHYLEQLERLNRFVDAFEPASSASGT